MYKNLEAEMTRASLSGRELSKKININAATFSKKMTGKALWKLKEMLSIQKEINLRLGSSYTLDYLFKTE